MSGLEIPIPVRILALLWEGFEDDGSDNASAVEEYINDHEYVLRPVRERLAAERLERERERSRQWHARKRSELEAELRSLNASAAKYET